VDILRDIPMAATFDPMAWKHVQAMLMVDVPHPEKALLMVLATFANSKTSEARPSLNTLKAAAGLGSRKSVVRVLERLKEKGLIESVPSREATNVYRVVNPVESSDEVAGEIAKGCPRDTCPTDTPSVPVIQGISSTTSVNVSDSKASIGKTIKKNPKGLTEAAERIYQHYPRKVQKKAAIAKLIPILEDRGVEFIEERVKTFAEAWVQRVEVEGEASKRFIPYMSSWLNQGRYDDDTAEWFPVKRKKANHAKGW